MTFASAGNGTSDHLTAELFWQETNTKAVHVPYKGGAPAMSDLVGGQVDAIPGQVNDTWFRADREGTYRGQSSFYSGTSYAAMRSWVTVVSPERYRRFVSLKRRQIAAAQRIVQGAIQSGGTGGSATP